jgi:hypothetical protein
MLVKEFIGRLNSYNMDAVIEFDGGNDFEIKLVDNDNDKLTDEGNVQKVIFTVVTKEVEEPDDPAAVVES